MHPVAPDFDLSRNSFQQDTVFIISVPPEIYIFFFDFLTLKMWRHEKFIILTYLLTYLLHGAESFLRS